MDIVNLKEKFKLSFDKFVTNILMSNRCVLLSYVHPAFRNLA